jgi:uncharacterized damage-inducible protein DinB
MLVETIRTLYGYNRWANEQLLDAADALTPEQWLTPGTAGHGSVRDTLMHVISAHRNWLTLWTGERTADELFAQGFADGADYPDVAAVRAAWDEVDRASEQFLAGLTDADLQRRFTGTFPWSGQRFDFALWQMMVHVANHSTAHRSEAAAMATAFGRSPGYLDLMGWIIEQPPALAAA